MRRAILHAPRCRAGWLLTRLSGTTHLRTPRATRFQSEGRPRAASTAEEHLAEQSPPGARQIQRHLCPKRSASRRPLIAYMLSEREWDLLLQCQPLPVEHRRLAGLARRREGGAEPRRNARIGK